MKKTNFVSTFILLFLSGFILRAQDIHFSQVHEAPLFLSPANTGFFNGYFRAIANYRNQWASMNKAYQTMALSLDGGLFRSKKRPAFMGIGFTIFNDRAGVASLRKTTAQLNMSGLVKLGKKSAMSVGLAGGASGTSANYERLTYESQFNGNYLDPTLSTPGSDLYQTYTSVDVAAGIAYEYSGFNRDNDHDDAKFFRIAFGAFHLNRARQEFGPGSNYREPIRLAGSFTSVYDVPDTKVTLTPTMVYQRQGKFEQLMVGTFIKYRMTTGTKITGAKTQNALGFGVFYRWKDALVPKLTAEFGDYAVGLSYDINISNYRTASNYMGGFEVSLRYNSLASSLFESKREFR